MHFNVQFNVEEELLIGPREPNYLAITINLII
jgi:hypothetical protein